MIFNELKFKSKNEVELTYIEDPYPVANEIGKRKIVFIFQSLGDEKSSDQRYRYPYTLLDGLRYFNARKIYIKDDHGLVGDYYIGTQGMFQTKQAVVEFINKKITEYQIETKDVILLGFSKGGFASLMFGFEIKVGVIIAGVPQFDLENWIDKYKPFLNYIYPNNPTSDEKQVYKEYLKKIIENSYCIPDKVYIITSKKDNTFEEHIPSLLRSLTKKSVKFSVYYNNEFVVTKHNDVIKNSLNEILAILAYELSDNSLKKILLN